MGYHRAKTSAKNNLKGGREKNIAVPDFVKFRRLFSSEPSDGIFLKISAKPQSLTAIHKYQRILKKKSLHFTTSSDLAQKVFA